LIRFEYLGFHGCPSACGLDIQRLAGSRTLVVCTELPNNPGTSVTNFAEQLATLVCQRFAIAPQDLLWIEHYPASETHGPEPDWDWVEFTWTGHEFIHPRWRPVRPEDWKQFGVPDPASGAANSR
jgi:hypothetical protein